jgi:hypothetical protein
LDICCKINQPSTQQLVIDVYVQGQEFFELFCTIFFLLIWMHVVLFYTTWHVNNCYKIMYKCVTSMCKLCKCMMWVNTITTLLPHIYWRLVFVVGNICRSSFIFTIKVLYLAKTCLTRDNMEIHCKTMKLAT